MPEEKKPLKLRFNLKQLDLKDMEIVVENLEGLPDKVGLRFWVSKEKLQSGDFNSSVLYDLWKTETTVEGEKLQVYSPDGVNLPDNVLAAMLYGNACLRRVLEDELKKRKEFRNNISMEIDSFTGTEGVNDE